MEQGRILAHEACPHLESSSLDTRLELTACLLEGRLNRSGLENNVRSLDMLRLCCEVLAVLFPPAGSEHISVLNI